MPSQKGHLICVIGSGKQIMKEKTEARKDIKTGTNSCNWKGKHQTGGQIK